MPKQMKGGSWGAIRAGKSGTSVKKTGAQAGLFRPCRQGISAHGEPRQVNARETYDRRQS